MFVSFSIVIGIYFINSPQIFTFYKVNPAHITDYELAFELDVFTVISVDDIYLTFAECPELAQKQSRVHLVGQKILFLKVEDDSIDALIVLFAHKVFVDTLKDVIETEKGKQCAKSTEQRF